jgi:hypothetical protein
MTKHISVPRGTADILPSEIPLWQQVESKARSLLKIYGFSEIRTPIYEDIGLFKRSLGQTSDVVVCSSAPWGRQVMSSTNSFWRSRLPQRQEKIKGKANTL